MKKTVMKANPVKAKAKPKKPFPLSLLYMLILAVVVVIVYNQVYEERIFSGGDNVVYFITGKAIANGQGYTNINSPFNTPATWFPPGYPLLSAAAMLLFGEDIQVMNKANGVFLFISLVLLYLIALRLTKNKHLAFAVTLITGLNMHMLHYAMIAMSEMPFIMMSLGAVYFFMRISKPLKPYADYNFWLFMFFLVFSYYIRPMGIVLGLSAVLYYLLAKNWKISALIVLVFLLSAAPWYLRNRALGENRYANIIMKKNALKPEAGEMATAADWTQRVKKNVQRYIAMEIPSALLCYEYTDYKVYKENLPENQNKTMGVIFVLLGIAGFFFLKDYRWFIVFYMCGTTAVLMFFPEVWFGSRLMLPVVPLLYLLAVIAVYQAIIKLLEKLKVKNSFSISFLPFLFLLFLPVSKNGIDYLTKLKNEGQFSPGFERFMEVAKWAKTNIPRNSVVVCRKPEFFYLFSDCKSTSYLFTLDSEELIENMKKNKATHVVFDAMGLASTSRYLLPALRKFPEKFKVLQHLKRPDTYLFEIHYDCGYKGETKDGMRNGYGVSHYADGTIYEGNWLKDKKEGQGTLTGTNGFVFKGEFRNNLRNGHGQLFDKNNVLRVEGDWANDRLNGYAEIYDAKGKLIRKGIMKDDKFISADKH